MRNRSLLSTPVIIARYASGEPMASIAQAAGITRIGVWKHLKRAEVATVRRAPPLDVTCAVCGKSFRRLRWKVLQAIRMFCSRRCYINWIKGRAIGYIPNRRSSRLARKVVARLYPLTPTNVVHHHDKNGYHNAPTNLAVFFSQREHMSFHRGGAGLPLWDGAKQ